MLRGESSFLLRAGALFRAVSVPGTFGPVLSFEPLFVYMVEVHDDEGKHIADATFTMFYTGATLDDMKY